MKKNELKKEYYYGVIFFVLGISLKHFTIFQNSMHLKEFLTGMCMALAILMYIISFLPEEKYQKLKQFKKTLFRRE